jgi:uncharacterized protein with PIN domain
MQTSCPRCGAPLERTPRSLVGRALFRKVQLCKKCGYRLREWRVPFEAALTFMLSRYSRCIQCGSYKVRRLTGRDEIDRVSVHPLSMLVGLTLAPFYHCNPCRLQYHDWRAVHPSAKTEPKSPT